MCPSHIWQKGKKSTSPTTVCCVLWGKAAKQLGFALISNQERHLQLCAALLSPSERSQAGPRPAAPPQLTPGEGFTALHLHQEMQPHVLLTRAAGKDPAHKPISKLARNIVTSNTVTTVSYWSFYWHQNHKVDSVGRRVGDTSAGTDAYIRAEWLWMCSSGVQSCWHTVVSCRELSLLGSGLPVWQPKHAETTWLPIYMLSPIISSARATETVRL